MEKRVSLWKVESSFNVLEVKRVCFQRGAGWQRNNPGTNNLTDFRVKNKSCRNDLKTVMIVTVKSS